MARDKELEADMAAAADLMGASRLNSGQPSISDLSSMVADHVVGPETLQNILTATPKTKDDFAALSQQIVAAIISRHASHPLYPAFAEALAKDVCEPLTAVQTRKVSSSVGIVGNTKQQEERDKANGKKKVSANWNVGISLDCSLSV